MVGEGWGGVIRKGKCGQLGRADSGRPRSRASSWCQLSASSSATGSTLFAHPSHPRAPCRPAFVLPRRQAVALNPDHFRAYKLMGSALYALGDFEGAKAALRESLK